jgi:[acyl-carrier-protein] S-malonyltransferase
MGLIAYIFPGQGSQFVGMGKDIYDNFSEARLVFEEAEDITRMKIRKLAFEGPEDELSRTANTQPVLFVMSAAVLGVLKSVGVGSKTPPSFFAGHSLGEYTALFASGVVSLGDEVGIVKVRGGLMQEAVPEGEGSMAAILGMEADKIEKIVGEVSNGKETVVIANYNSPGQIVISGHSSAVMEAAKRAEDAGAAKVVVLKVSVPSHSPLMEDAAVKLGEELSKVDFSDFDVPVISNVTASPYPGKGSISDLLTKQLTSPVKWDDSIRYMIGEGATDFIEVGPGRVLAGLLKRIDRKAGVMSVGDLETIKEAEKKYQ